MIMRGSGRLQRFALLPFSIRCDSESSVALAAVSSNSNTRDNGEKEKSKMKENQRHSKGLFTQGLQRLIKGFKTFSQIFLYKEETEEMETEMEIGFPTDVKHVTHIGLDGSTTINTLKAADKLLSFPSISLQQFELAMAAQSHAPISA